MKLNMFRFVFVISILIGCSNSKKYKYIEVREEAGLFGGTERKEKEGEIIEATSDSAAYLHAFQRFSIALKVSRDMKEAYSTVSLAIPKSFKLYNDQEVDITHTTFFAEKDKKEKEIEESIFSRGNGFKESIENKKKEDLALFKETASVNTEEVKRLETYFTQTTDEFSNNNKVWVKPKTAPKYTNRNALYCYFQTEEGVPSNFRLRLQYYSDDWLFFKQVQFSIDGKAYNYIPIETETDSGNGGHIWEWFDESVSQSDTALISALAHAKSAKMKLIGRQYFDVQTISSEQILSIKRTLEFFKAMGGNY